MPRYRSAAVSIIVVAAAATAGSCTLDREGTGELLEATGGSPDASAGGDGGTTGPGGAGGSPAGGFGGSSASQGGSGGTAGSDGGAGGTAGSASGGGSTGASGGNAGGGGEVDCLDGLDNDSDGEVDCADDDCKPDYECIAAPPAEWSGYYRVRRLPWSDPEPAQEPCPNGSPAQRFYENASGDITCACSCGPLSGASCTPARIGCATNDDCSNPSDWTAELSDGGCHKPDIGSSDRLSCLLLDGGSVASMGSCTPGVTKSSVAPFQSILDVCGPDVGTHGCFPGYACTHRGGGAYAGPPCIQKADNAVCPLGWGARYFGFECYTDTRDCTPCTCTPNTTCSPTEYTIYDRNGCDSPKNTVSSSSCVDGSEALDFGTWSIRRTGTPQASGQCVGGGGESTGSLTTSGPTTFCCQQ